jgi:GH35 family endo-1,4-beta-xylanase
MKKCLFISIAFMLIIAGTLKAQSVLSWDFESNSIGDTLYTIGWSPADIQSVVADDPVASGNNVLKNTVHNYNAAPVLMFVLPAGKTLADYDTLTFKGYFEKGDVAYKDIIAQAYQTKPTGHHFLDTDTLGLYNRAMGSSNAWENISLDISNASSFSDTVYIALGINCAGTSGTDTTTWYADDIQLVAKTQPQIIDILSYDFENYDIGDSLFTIGWSPADIQSVVVDDPLASGNNVLRNTVHNYNAAPVLTFVLPDGKTLADYDTLTFNGYFQKGDVAYKDIIAQAYQTKPIGHHFLDTDTLGLYSRAQGVSANWENISLNISNASSFSDTVYIALGINCAGTSGADTTTWFADDIELIAKVNTPPPPDTGNVVVNGGFEDSPVGIDTTGATKGWLFQVASVTPAPVFEIVSDTVEEGNNALKVTVQGLGTNQWDIQTVADSIHITPGVRYDYSIWAKADQPGAQVNFTVGNYSFSEYGAIRPANLTTKWNKYTLQITVNDGQTVIRAPIHFNYSGNVDNAVYIDNLRIAKHIEVVDSSLIWKGPALATGSPKFLGSAGDAPANDFKNYWTQLTPENAGKWGSVGTSQDTTQWNWGGLDNDYNYAKNNGLIFKDHCLIWGQQQPSWISDLDSAQQISYIETWFRMVGQRYPDMDMIDVVNEPLNGHNPPDGGNGRANYKNALGGNGATGWDWVIKSFELARQYIPNAKLLINDYGIINNNAATTSYIQVINLLKDRGLIDGIGCQAHGLENTSAATIKSNLDRLAATGIPIYISEFDLNIQNDNQQKTKYQELFPVMWQHPGVAGVTLWGYIQGHTWVTYSYLVNSNGTARPALWWLADYIENNPVGVDKTASGLPTEYELEQNYPNPFNPTTNIRYSIIKTTNVTLRVYDILGRLVKTLVNTEQAPGNYTIIFNAQNLASGVYFYRLNAGNYNMTKKLLLLK